MILLKLQDYHYYLGRNRGTKAEGNCAFFKKVPEGTKSGLVRIKKCRNLAFPFDIVTEMLMTALTVLLVIKGSIITVQIYGST
jgi:hypothetical protein